jgi:hypothetical protein
LALLVQEYQDDVKRPFFRSRRYEDHAVDINRWSLSSSVTAVVFFVPQKATKSSAIPEYLTGQGTG